MRETKKQRNIALRKSKSELRRAQSIGRRPGGTVANPVSVCGWVGEGKCLDGGVALRPSSASGLLEKEALTAHRSKNRRPGLRWQRRKKALGMGAAKLASGQPGSSVHVPANQSLWFMRRCTSRT